MQARFRMGWVTVLLVVLLAVGCGGAVVDTSPPPAGSSAVSFMVRDTPPAGVTILSFEITITSAVLQPGNVQLVSAPIEIELKRLEIETAFLSTVNVPAGTYNSIQVTFSNPELTFLNNTGSSIGSCANGAVCEISPPLNQVSVTYSGSPFPLTIQANTPLGLLLDFDLLNSLGANLSISPVVSLLRLPAVQGTGRIEDIEDVVGRVSAKNTANNEFTIELTLSGQALTVRVDATTEFDDFDDIGCNANNFTCVAVGQIVEVDIELRAGGVLFAKGVELLDDINREELEGIVVGVQCDTSRFLMVIVEEIPNITGVEIGNLVTVFIQSGANFRIDEDGLVVPPDLSFASCGDIIVGQNLQVRRTSGSAGTTVNTDRVRLRMSRFTAKVKTPGPATFTVDNLPTLFTAQSPAVTEIEVRTSAQTDFDNVANAASLAIGDTVSLRGLLFRRLTGIPSLVAKKVRKR